MEKFIKFSEKYFVKELFLIFIFSLLLFGLFYGKQEAYLVDVGREAYIPWQILQGKLLYKDIFNVYGPLGYQINALAYCLFGTNLNTLYLMGFLNSLLICFTAFFSVNLFASRKISLAVTAMIMAVLIYIRTFFNFIFAYSYSAVYALSGFFLSLFTMLLFIRDKKTKYLVLSFLFAGFSFANKIENLPYFLILFACLAIFKTGWKKSFASLCVFLVFPVLSFGILLLQGVGFSDFLNGFELIKKLTQTPAVNYFYNAYGLYWNPLHVAVSVKYFLKLGAMLIVFGGSFYLINFVGENYIKKVSVKRVLNIFTIFLMLLTVVKYLHRFAPVSEKIFCWLGLFCAALLICILIYYSIRFIKEKSGYCLETIDKMFLFLLISALSVSIKGISGITTECYGTFSLAALFLPFIIFPVLYMPKKFNREVFEKTIQNLCFIVIFAFLLINFIRIGEKKLYPVNTPNGKLFVKEIFKSQNEFIHYIIQKTPKDSVIVSVPEGAIINFLSQRQSNNLYYYLIPVNVQVFGEEKIVDDFKKNPPDYFIMNNVPYTPFNVGSFCDYAPKTCSFIKTNYTPEVQTSDAVQFVLYKKNN